MNRFDTRYEYRRWLWFSVHIACYVINLFSFWVWSIFGRSCLSLSTEYLLLFWIAWDDSPSLSLLLNLLARFLEWNTCHAGDRFGSFIAFELREGVRRKTPYWFTSSMVASLLLSSLSLPGLPGMWKNSPLEKRSPDEKSPQSCSPGKKVYEKKIRRKNDPRKKGLRKNGPRKNVLKIMVFRQKNTRNLTDFFIFIDWFHYTHETMFDVYLTILHALHCGTLKESRKVRCWVLGFRRLITSQHSTHTHTPRCSTLTPRFFVSEFWVFIAWSPILKLQVHKYRKILVS